MATKTTISKKRAVKKGAGRKTSGRARAGTSKRFSALDAAAQVLKSAVNPKRFSALNAAAQVLAKAGTPMKAQELISAMAEQGLWSSPKGRTPHATLHAALIREIATKGNHERFRKVDRGQFEYHAPKSA